VPPSTALDKQREFIMYISDYAQAIDNLEDCMFALCSMDLAIGKQNYATQEDLAYVEPRFTEALRIMLALNNSKEHRDKFRDYIGDQRVSGTNVYQALNIHQPYGTFADQLAHFLSNILQCPKDGEVV